MGSNDGARVDVGALLDVAGRYDAVADVVDGVARTHLARLTFDGALAGREHTARGDGLRRAVDDLVVQLRMWSRASREIGSALGSSSARYVDADARSVARLG